MNSQQYRLLALVIVGPVIVAGLMIWRHDTDSSQQDETTPSSTVQESVSESLPPLEKAQTPFLNIRNETAYLGNQGCVDCHAEQFESYQLTAHSRSLRSTIASEEPPSGEYLHEASGRYYEVYREGDELRHREFISDSSGNEVNLSDYAVNYTMGSGRFSLSYLIEEDQFLFESPVTWYSARKEWAMSPGFDRQYHRGFQRLTGVGCVYCHAGRVVEESGNSFRPQLLHMAIGCENCHGPGSLHASERLAKSESQTVPDLTIVNPVHLDRALQEAVCANCHLRGDATVLRRGMEMNDYRPGLPLSEVRIDFGLESPKGEMEVVGHVEQMRQSLCYLNSESMTCTTCHNPHYQPAEEERQTYFRNTCLKCHEVQSCGLSVAERLQNHPQDNCITCHMPTTDTDIPHFAFTHHRIAVHLESPETSSKSAPASLGKLVPLTETTHLSETELNRLTGLAYLEYAEKKPRHYGEFMEQARSLLERGDADGDGLAALARIYWEREHPRAAEIAQAALTHKDISTRSKVNALVVLADLNLRAGRGDLAFPYCRQLVATRRHTGDWEMLAAAYALRGEMDASNSALETAVKIAPDRLDLRERLERIYQRAGQEKNAARHRQVIDSLK
ncbi:MAG: hypothetical protein HUJ26_02050 [Planctomycetaceae bacterium]|nr:hypothetical protein [Planctomycetaceae bacterium]